MLEDQTIEEMTGAGVNAKKMHKMLKDRGWSLTRSSGEHDVFTHPKSQKDIAVPKHKGDMRAPMVIKLLKIADLKEEDEIQPTKTYEDLLESFNIHEFPTTRAIKKLKKAGYSAEVHSDHHVKVMDPVISMSGDKRSVEYKAVLVHHKDVDKFIKDRS